MVMRKHQMLGSSLSSLLALMVAGCNSGPDYSKPAVPAEANAAFTIQAPEFDGGTEPPAEWWRLYRDDALDELVQQALAANTDLRVAEANLARAKAIFQETNSAKYPGTELGAGASYGRDQTSWPGPGNAPKQWSYSGSIDIAYEVDLFGRVRRDIQAAQFDLEAEAATRDAVRLVVVAETTRAYIDACTLGKAIRVSEQSLKLTDQSLELVRQRKEAGAATQLDVDRATTSRARAEAALSPLQRQRQQRLLELTTLLGRTPSEVPESARQCQQVNDITGAIPVGDGATLLRRRPDVRAAERQLGADTARIGVAVASLYPQITLGASANYLRNDTLSGDRAWSFGIGPLISWQFPNQLAARARISEAKAQSAAALATFDGTVLNALKESELALANYSVTLKQHSALTGARDSAKSAYLLAEQQYEAGAIGYLDVLMAQATLIETEAELVSVEQQIGSQRTSLFLALGGGWESPNDPPISQYVPASSTQSSESH